MRPRSEAERGAAGTSASIAMTKRRSRALLELSDREPDHRSKEVITAAGTGAAEANAMVHSFSKGRAGDETRSCAGGIPMNPTRLSAW